MPTNYYYLISGLPELAPDDRKISLTSKTLREQLKENLTEKDFELVQLFYLPFDHQNILNAFFEKDEKWDERGNYSREQVGQITDKKQFDTLNLQEYPPYLQGFLTQMFSEDAPADEVTASRILSAKYYNFLENSENEFVQKVAKYQRNVSNIITALNGRKYELDVSKSLIGNDEVVEALQKSHASDFGLASAVDYIEDILQIYDTDNITQREYRLDMHKWKFLEDTTFFNYFTVEKVTAFVLKLFIVERWNELDEEKGKEMFDKIFNDIKSEFEFPEEYTLTYGKKR